MMITTLKTKTMRCGSLHTGLNNRRQNGIGENSPQLLVAGTSKRYHLMRRLFKKFLSWKMVSRPRKKRRRWIQRSRIQLDHSRRHRFWTLNITPSSPMLCMTRFSKWILIVLETKVCLHRLTTSHMAWAKEAAHSSRLSSKVKLNISQWWRATITCMLNRRLISLTFRRIYLAFATLCRNMIFPRLLETSSSLPRK